jgi:hypothetical protein
MRLGTRGVQGVRIERPLDDQPILKAGSARYLEIAVEEVDLLLQEHLVGARSSGNESLSRSPPAGPSMRGSAGGLVLVVRAEMVLSVC